MQIIQELRAGTVHFSVLPEGTEGFSTRPPTQLNLRAARALEELIQVLQGLERANQTLTQQLQQNTQELNAQRSLLQKFMTDAEQSSAGTVRTNTEAATHEEPITGTTEVNPASQAT